MELINRFMAKAAKQRAVGVTDMNDFSSRTLQEKYDPYLTNMRTRKHCQANKRLKDQERVFMRRQACLFSLKPSTVKHAEGKLKINKEQIDQWLKEYSENLAAAAQEKQTKNLTTSAAAAKVEEVTEKTKNRKEENDSQPERPGPPWKKR